MDKTINPLLIACRQQFPIMISEAYNECVINVQKGIKRSLLCIRLSLVTKANGLYIVGEFEHPETIF